MSHTGNTEPVRPLLLLLLLLLAVVAVVVVLVEVHLKPMIITKSRSKLAILF